MLLSEFTVVNSRGLQLNMPLEDISGGIVVRNIEGLEPTKATLVSSGFARQNGEQFHSSKREVRDIKIQLGLQPADVGMSVQELRDQLYAFFMPPSLAVLSFHQEDRLDETVVTSARDLNIEGRVEEFLCPLFTADPVADISIRCFDPDFYGPDPIEFDGYTTYNTNYTTHTNPGTVESGAIFEIRLDRPLSEFTIYNTLPDGTVEATNISYPFLTYDVLTINSNPGMKSVVLTRDGVESHILYAMTPQSPWLTIHPGANAIRVYAAGSPIPFTLTYTAKYGGL